jgi:GT2 family glycosyltransferase
LLSGADEIDFGWRVQEAGYQVVFARDAVVHMRLRADLRSTVRQQFRYATGTSYLYRKHMASGMLPPQTLWLRLAMFKVYGRRLAGVGSLRELGSWWRLALRMSWIAGSLAAARRNRVLV